MLGIAMDNLMRWVHHCRTAGDLDLRLRLMEEILTDVRPCLHLYLSSRCPRDEVDDVLQMTLVAISTSIREFKGTSPGEFWSWCYRIAARKRVDEKRRGQESVSVSERELWQAVEASGHGVLPPGGERLDIEDAIALLQNLERPCYGFLWERFVLDRSLREIGDARGVSEAAARMKIKRCLETAAKLLSKLS